MKKIVILFVVLVGLISCKSTSPVATKLDNKTEAMLKGNWKITSVTFPGQDYIKVKSFDMFDSQCFVGSEWSLVSNNNKGKMALYNASCGEYTSAITWYINKEGKFVLKFLNTEKSKKVSQGYVLNVGSITEGSFQLLDKITVGATPTNIIYEFSKIQE